MLVIKYKKENDIIVNVTLKGHAEYEVLGKDIVCASASSIFITTVNAIMSFDKESIHNSGKPLYSITNIKKDEITNKLLDNMISLFKELESEYKKNIKVMEE